MKKALIAFGGGTLSLFVFLVAGFACFAQDTVAPSESSPVFRAGAAMTDISPTSLPVITNGGFFEGKATKVLDPLHARALVLNDGTNWFAFCTVDSCMVPVATIEDIKALVTEKTGLAPENICVSATHCHSAPSLMRCHYTPIAEEYLATLPERVATAIIDAYNNLTPVRVGYGTCREPRFVFCRRFIMKPGTAWENRPEFTGARQNIAQMNPGRQNPNAITRTGVPDQTVYTLAFQTLDGKPFALLANYSTHYAGSSEVSADYFGVFAGEIAKRLDAPDSFVAMMTNGTSGDTNCLDFLKSAEEQPFDMFMVGTEIAKDVEQVYKNMKFLDWVPLGVESTTLEMAIKQASADDIATAKQYLADLKAAGKEPSTVEDAFANATIECSELPPTRPILLQAIRVGDVGIGTIPCEVYSFTGHDLRAYSPFTPTFIISLANGYNGYIPTLDQFELGGYTTWRTQSSILEPTAEPTIRQTIRGMLEKLDQDGQK